MIAFQVATALTTGTRTVLWFHTPVVFVRSLGIAFGFGLRVLGGSTARAAHDAAHVSGHMANCPR